MNHSQIRVVRTDADQPWHASIVPGNGQKVWTTENYNKKVGAERAIVSLAKVLGHGDPYISGGALLTEHGDLIGEVEYVDQRAATTTDSGATS